jgi:DNA-binding transcriptional ArsR family regulator
MNARPDVLFKTLSDPTRRAIFERLVRDGKLSAHVLTSHSGVSQPVVSKHLGVLKVAGLVSDRRDGRETYYSADPKGLAPLVDWMKVYGIFGSTGSIGSIVVEEDGSVTDAALGVRSVVLERELPHPPERIWRALTQGD